MKDLEDKLAAAGREEADSGCQCHQSLDLTNPSTPSTSIK